MLSLKLSLAAACTVAATSSFAASVFPVFTDQGLNTTTAQGTRLYRADLTGLGLTEIAAITVTDSNSGIGGSSGAYSGFDLDAIFLDIDGDATTLGDQTAASSFMFSAGSLRNPPQAGNTAGPTNGSDSANSVNEAFATLGAIDAVWFGAGSLTLGDGGSLTAIFNPEVILGPSLFLFVGEVSGDAGELVVGSIEVSDQVPTPEVPVPASVLLLGSALGGLVLRRRRA